MPEDPDKLEYEYRKSRYEAYIHDRDALRNDSLEVSERYDKAILLLAGGALALSLTFLEKIAPHPLWWSFIFLGVAWLCLIASVLLELFALSTSQTVTNAQTELLNEDYRQYLLSLPDHPPVPEAIRPPESLETIEKWKASTRSYNAWSKWLLTAGVSFLCIFSLVNLPFHQNNDQQQMSDQKKPAPSRPLNESKGSYVAPSNALPPPPPPKPTAPAPTAAPKE